MNAAAGATRVRGPLLACICLALAIRAGALIYAEEAVLDTAGIAIADEQESEVERFREFLDQISPEDFETEGES